MKLTISRQERGEVVPAFWKACDCGRSARFRKIVNPANDEQVRVYTDGCGVVSLDGVRIKNENLVIPKGEHELVISVGNLKGIPAVLVEGENIYSDETCEADNIMTLFKSNYKPVGFWNLSDKNVTPTDFELPLIKTEAKIVYENESETMLDFGEETYIKLVVKGSIKDKKIDIQYGESIEEAECGERCTLSEHFIPGTNTITAPAHACRYVKIIGGKISGAYGLYENLPKNFIGKFECDDEKINEVYRTALKTYDLTSRIFFLDGIKRDHWVWGGDAYLSELFDFYSCFDTDIIKRTLIALYGNNPIECHINGIMDYSFIWLLSVGKYYEYTADKKFIKENYSDFSSMMDYCLGFMNDSGLIEGNENVWTFIDWSDMNKNGAMCIMQMLCVKALEVMHMLSCIAGRENMEYLKTAVELRTKINDIYWSENGYITTVINGTRCEEITRHANIFATILGFADEEKKKIICERVLNNDDITKITTPYFELYELEALALTGRLNTVTNALKNYWYGMIKEGATAFWEDYEPSQHGTEKYEKYGEPFDKSLCHAWGAGPLYLIGRYYLGVYPTKPGYEEFVVSPCKDTLGYIRGTVPVNGGYADVFMNDDYIEVFTDTDGGTLVYGGKQIKLEKGRKTILHI